MRYEIKETKDYFQLIRNVAPAFVSPKIIKVKDGFYIKDAIIGKCFLFHVEKDGERATVEVGKSGQVLQSKGPCNEVNQTSLWAINYLQQWGQAFPQISKTGERVDF